MAVQLDIRHYETIVAIVELGTVTAAARELHATQSTLSHRLAEAERRLGVQLFDRGRHRRLTPTRAGLATHQAAGRALEELGRIERMLLAERPGVTSIVRIAVGSYDCFHWYPNFLIESREANPDIELELVVVGDTPSESLASATADVVIAPGEPTGAIELIPALDDELVLIVEPNHWLAKLDYIEPFHLTDQTYLTYNSSPTPGFEYDRFIRSGDDYPRLVTVVPQTSAITELVAAGVGVSILSRWALDPAISTGRLRSVRCSPVGLPLPWNLALRAGESEDSASRRVAEHLATVLSAEPSSDKPAAATLG